jgi:glycosyltransferase involved in cell wall biosynthesis
VNERDLKARFQEVKNSSPRVTVIMPVYNAMPYLRLSVGSILEQSFADFCLITIDDGSTDGSLDYLRSITDPRLRVLQMERRQGQGAARNAALCSCSTEYVAFADADDEFLPRRLELQVSYLDRHPEIGMLGTKIAYIGISGRAGFSPPLALDHAAIRRDLLLGRHAFVNGTLAFRTCVLEHACGFRVDGAGEDWDLFLRMTEATKVANLPQILCHVRLHGGSTNVQQARILRLRYAHACECAKRREAHLPEDTFEEFSERQSRRPVWVRCMDWFDQTSARQYRAAMAAVLEGATLRGYSRLALAAVLSPRRLAQRIDRMLRLVIRIAPKSKANPESLEELTEFS